MKRVWDMLDAELADTARSAPWNREKRACYYCGEPTRATSGICWRHDDLPALDPVLNEPRVYPATCPSCRGTGGGTYNDCPTCDGNGVV
jgi:hypothetical protein